MKRRRLVILATAIIGIFVMIMWAGPKAIVYWERWRAIQAIEMLSIREREHLGCVPRSTVFPQEASDAQLSSVVTIDDYSFQVPHVDTVDRKSHSVLLKYGQLQVLLREPFSTEADDIKVQPMGYPNVFRMLCAAYKLCPQDLKSASDLATLRRVAFLLSQKMSICDADLCSNFEQFDCGNICGFIIPPKADNKSYIVVEVYMLREHMACGLWLTDSNEAWINDIHWFISRLQIARNAH
jgi:hypothetical protein